MEKDITKSEQLEFMRRAIKLSQESVRNGGGPFGAVVVRGNKIVGEGFNQVTLKHDPTAHAEVTAIRQAARELGTFDLSGCDIYTSCEPCPMCLGAIYWAHIDRIFYGNNRHDAAEIGFDDEMLYHEIALEPDLRSKKMEQLLPGEAIKAFEAWEKKEDKTRY